MQRFIPFSLFTSTFNDCRLTIARTVSSKKAMLSKKSPKTPSRLSASTLQLETSLKQFSRWKDYWERSLERIIGKDYWEGLLGKVNNESEKVVISGGGGFDERARGIRGREL